MKAQLTATLKHKDTGAVETVTVTVETTDVYSELYHVVSAVHEALHAARCFNWGVELVQSNVIEAPPGFFAPWKEKPAAP